jgi:NADH-ubiquinone oxidoreductase chain 5
MAVLAVASIFFGYILSELFVGLGTFYWVDSLQQNVVNFSLLEPEFLNPLVKNLPLFISILGSLIAFFGIYFINSVGNKTSFFPLSTSFIYWNKISAFFYNAGYFNTIYNNWFLRFFQFSYITTNKYIDKGILEFFGPFGFYKLFRSLSKKSISLMPNIIFFMLGWMFFFIVFIISIILLQDTLLITNNIEIIVLVMLLLLVFFIN